MVITLLPSRGDTACEMNFTLIHAIEHAPGWPYWDLLADTSHW